MLQTPNQIFIEERNSIVESRKQIIEVFINKRDSIEPHSNLQKFKGMPIVIEGTKAEIAELEKPCKKRFEGKKTVNYGTQKPFKAE